MKVKLLTSLVAWINGVLGTDFKIDGEVEFSDEQKQKLDQHAKKEGFAEKFEQELKSFNENKEANELITQFMQNQASGEEDPDAAAEPVAETNDGDKPTLTDNVRQLTTKVSSLTDTNKELKNQVEKLSGAPEVDQPIEKVKAIVVKMKHSKTHLFGSSESFNAFEGRPWNQTAQNLKSEADIPKNLTDWNTVNIDKINADFGAYSRKNLNKIVSLMRDAFGIPAHWKIISNVSDEMTWAQLLSGEITQGKKKAWLPKNKNKFIPQIAKIYDKQIDMTWTGYELKKIEKSWLNTFFNDVASHPHKMSFVEYLVAELLRQARKEDKITIVNGVFFPIDNFSIAGDFMNAMSGLLKLIDTKRRAGEYNAFDLGAPSVASAYDYINAMVAALPHDIRIMPDLQLLCSPIYKKAYQDGLELAKGTNTDYKGKGANYVDGYPNIKFVELLQLEGSDFMAITTWDNISIMVDKPGEESMVTFDKDKRDINAFVDYKLGVHVAAFGAQMADGKLVGFGNQLFFSNDVPVLEDVFVPVPGNLATPDLQYHHSLIIGEHNTAPTDITGFQNANPGQKVILRGNNDTNPSTVKNNADILIGADVELNSTTELVLMARSDGKFVKLYENDLSVESTDVVLAADATTADAADGTSFVTQENTGATAITNILNAVKDEVYRITGGSSVNATTIANAGNFTLSAAMTLNDGSWIELYYNGSKFVETQRG